MIKQDKHGVLILVGASVIFLVLFACAYRLKASSDKYDQETLCRQDGNYITTKVLIDKTDPWSEAEKKRLATLIRRIKGNLAEDERLSIYLLDETGTYSPSPVFDMCNPGRGDQANSLYENPRLVQKQFEVKFTAPLDNILGELLRPGIAEKSPILETASSLRGDEEIVKLVIVSDMMQHSELASLYGTSKPISKDAIDKLCMPDKRYSEIQVYSIARPHISVSAQQQARNFWHRYLGQISQSMRWEAL